jgi:maltoporin
VQHNQDNFLGWGGENTLWLQYAQGSAGLDGNFGGDLTASSGVKAARVVESFTWQQGAFGGQAMAMWQQDKDAAGAKANAASLGGRVSYALTRNLKLLAELGHSRKKPDGGETAKLTKFTFAPALSTGPGFWNRPELRLYVTHAKWNDAAGNVTGQNAFIGKTSGTSYGAQVEIWY